MDMKFEELANDWLNYKKPSIKLSTYSNYYFVVQTRLIMRFKNVSLKQLTKYDFNEYVEKLMNKRLDNKTIKDTIIILKQILRFAELKYGMNMNIDLISMPKLKEKEICIFSSREYKKFKRFLLASDNPRHLGMLLGMLAGLRIGETCGLKWSDIDFEKKYIRINHILERVISENGKTKVVTLEPKTKKSKRIVPMSKELLQKLKLMSCKYDKEAYILTGNPNQYIEPIGYEGLYKRYLKSIRIRYKKFHCLRHTFATKCVEIGMPVKDLSMILGHANVAVTLNIYVHPNLDVSVKYLNKL